MDVKDRLLMQMLVCDLIKLNKSFKEFNEMIVEYKNCISDTDFSKEFSKEVVDSFCNTALLMNEVLNACNDFESKILKLSDSIKYLIVVKQDTSDKDKLNLIPEK